MNRALELAGFLAAHGIWCVSDGGPLIPMLGQIDRTGARSMSRLVVDQLEEGVAEGIKQLQANANNNDCAVLVYDGYIVLDSGKTDALFVEIRFYSNQPVSLSMAVPYRNPKTPEGFAVYRPKFLAYEGSDSPNYPAFGEAFFKGVDSHAKGAAVWNKAINQSI